MKSSGTVQIRDLWVDLREFHLREIDLDIAAGEYFVVLGPTGAGKTVLLETIAGLYQPQRGRVLLDGEEITHVRPEHRGIGFVYQDYALFPHLNVAENIAFGLRIQRSSGLGKLIGRKPPQENEVDIAGQVAEISRMLSIDHLLHRSPKTLSGGEQQRAALARALVIKPRVLLLDEPLSALDPETRESLQRELARVHRQLGATTLHVTHDFEEAVALGDRIAIVNQGRIVQVGTPEDIFRRPASEFVARFVGVRNIFAGALVEETDENGVGAKTFTFDAPKDAEAPVLKMVVVTDLTGVVQASIRPEDIILSREPIHSSARNCFRGRIIDIADRGTLIYVTVNAPPDFTCVITRRSREEMRLREGVEVYLAFKASAVHIF